jgi:protein SCO1/2
MKSEHRQKNYREILWVALGILIAAIAWNFMPSASPVQPPELTQGTLLPEAKPILPFELKDTSGQAFTQEQLLGKWSFIFFGYTHCPDVCPTTLQTLAQSIKTMSANNPVLELPQVIFVSVDPDRDSSERLKQFVGYFNDNFIGVSGEAEQIQAFTAQLGIIYAKVIDSPVGDYLVDHSAAVLLFDPNGEFRALFNVPHDANKIANDFLAIKKYFEARYK